MLIALPVRTSSAAGHMRLPRYTVYTAGHLYAYLDQVPVSYQRYSDAGEITRKSKKGGLTANFSDYVPLLIER